MTAPRTGVLALAAIVGLSAACASTTATVRPQPFPASSANPGTPPEATPRTRIVDAALALRGVSYRLGGDSPRSGLDCSGLVAYVYAGDGVVLPRTVAEQHRVGRRVPLDEIVAGDLIFFSTTGPGATHVGIALGAGSTAFVHAPGSGGRVRVERFDSPYWGPRLLDVRRIG